MNPRPCQGSSFQQSRTRILLTRSADGCNSRARWNAIIASRPPALNKSNAITQYDKSTPREPVLRKTVWLNPSTVTDLQLPGVACIRNFDGNFSRPPNLVLAAQYATFGALARTTATASDWYRVRYRIRQSWLLLYQRRFHQLQIHLIAQRV